MREGVVQRCGTGGVVRDRDDPLQPELVDDRFEVTELLPEAVLCTDGLLRLPKAQEIEGHHPTPGGH